MKFITPAFYGIFLAFLGVNVKEDPLKFLICLGLLMGATELWRITYNK